MDDIFTARTVMFVGAGTSYFGRHSVMRTYLPKSHMSESVLKIAGMSTETLRQKLLPQVNA